MFYCFCNVKGKEHKAYKFILVKGSYFYQRPFIGLCFYSPFNEVKEKYITPKNYFIILDTSVFFLTFSIRRRKSEEGPREGLKYCVYKLFVLVFIPHLYLLKR